MNILIAAGILSLGLVRPDPADLKPHLAPPKPIVFCACNGIFCPIVWAGNEAPEWISVSWYCFMPAGSYPPLPMDQFGMSPVLESYTEIPVKEMLKCARREAEDQHIPPCVQGEWSAW